MESKENTMTPKQAEYLDDLIRRADLRYEPKMVAHETRERCDKLTAALMVATRERINAGLSVEQASDLIDALKSTSYSVLAKTLFGADVKARMIAIVATL